MEGERDTEKNAVMSLTLLHSQMIGLYKDPHGKKIDSIGTQRLSSQEQLQSSGEAVVEELRYEVSRLKMCLRKYEV